MGEESKRDWDSPETPDAWPAVTPLLWLLAPLLQVFECPSESLRVWL